MHNHHIRNLLFFFIRIIPFLLPILSTNSSFNTPYSSQANLFAYLHLYLYTYNILYMYAHILFFFFFFCFFFFYHLVILLAMSIKATKKVTMDERKERKRKTRDEKCFGIQQTSTTLKKRL